MSGMSTPAVSLGTVPSEGREYRHLVQAPAGPKGREQTRVTMRVLRRMEVET